MKTEYPSAITCSAHITNDPARMWPHSVSSGKQQRFQAASRSSSKLIIRPELGPGAIAVRTTADQQ